MPSKKTHCLRGHLRDPKNLRSNGVSLYCKACAKINELNGRNRRRKENPLRFALQQLRRNAKKRGYYFALTVEDFPNLPTHCPVLGLELDYSGAGGPNAASFDRSDSRYGYVAENVVIMSRRANILKNNATIEELERVLDYIRQPAARLEKPER
jgi:hypothetical protein